MRGSKKRLGENHWLLTYDGKPINGKRKQHRVRFRGNSKAADARLHDLIEQVRGGFTGTNQTLHDYLKSWIASRTVSPNTLHRYDTQFKYVDPHLGHKRLCDVEPADLMRLYSALLKNGAVRKKSLLGLKASSVFTCHAFVKTALGDAARMGLIAFNPALRVRPPKPAQQAPPKVLTPVECSALLGKLAGSEWWLMILLASITGCRLGELLALDRKDFRLDECMLLVSRSVDRYANVKTPKNGRPRPVPIPPNLVPVLEEHLPASGALFPEQAKNSMSTSTRFRSRCKTLGFPGVHFHTFRHTVASVLMQKGVHPKAIKELLGHATVSYTMEVYSHLMPGAFDDTTTPLASLVTGGDDPKSSRSRTLSEVSERDP